MADVDDHRPTGESPEIRQCDPAERLAADPDRADAVAGDPVAAETVAGDASRDGAPPADVLLEADDAPARRRPLAPFVALAVGAVLVLLVVAFARTSGGPKDTAQSSLLGQPAPLVQTTTLDGQPFDLATRRGSWVVVNFFGTWCPPCRQEHPELVKFAQSQAQQPGGAELLTVINNDDPATVREWFAKNGGNWPVLTDPSGRIYVSFGVAKVPETWVIDPDGIVRARVITTVTADQLNALLAQLQGQGQGS